jgi:prepilin-type N-terminal cleavage/methylation domain-containing protein
MSRLSDERGFTLPEVMSAMFIALIVSLASFALIDFTIRRAGEVAGRVEATQKGRAAMDTITQHMRSQVCLNSTTPPLSFAGTNRVTFYSDLSNPADNEAPARHTLTYDPTAKTLVQTQYDGVRQGTNVVYPALPSRTRLLAENVVPDTGTAPIFKYYAYDTATPPRPVTELQPASSTVSLPATDLARTVRIEINFRALPPNAKQADARGALLVRDDVYVRAADPDDPRDVRPPDPNDPIPPICA